jgi:hypothetical protein
MLKMDREASDSWEGFLFLPSIVCSAGWIGTIMHGKKNSVRCRKGKTRAQAVVMWEDENKI